MHLRHLCHLQIELNELDDLAQYVAPSFYLSLRGSYCSLWVSCHLMEPFRDQIDNYSGIKYQNGRAFAL